MTEPETLAIRQSPENGLVTVELDRTESLNAMNSKMLDELVDTFNGDRPFSDEFSNAPIVVIQGEGDKSFCVGADIKEAQAKGSHALPGATGKGNQLMNSLENYDGLVIAKIDGYCMGGGFELALACDFRFASERSTFSLPEVNIGVFPGSGAMYRLTPLVGFSKAMELIMTGDQMDGKQAYSEGMVNEVYPTSILDKKVDEFIEKLTEKPPEAIREIKNVLYEIHKKEAGDEFIRKKWLLLSSTSEHKDRIDEFGG